MQFKIELGDITSYKTDAIVNAANENLFAGGGVCGAIFDKAGYSLLQAECEKLSPIKTGEAVITNGYNLKAKYIIHAVGPIYEGENSKNDLKNAYINSLNVAEANKLASIAFPSISTGIYGYPLNEASKIAIKAILEYNYNFIKEVIMVCYDKKTYDEYNNSYINYIKEKNTNEYKENKLKYIPKADIEMMREDRYEDGIYKIKKKKIEKDYRKYQ